MWIIFFCLHKGISSSRLSTNTLIEILMKYFLKHLLFCTVILLCSDALYAQLSQRVITVTQSTMDIPGLAKMIAAQTGVEYSLNMQNTSLKKNVRLKPGKWKLDDVMKAVQEQAGLNYKIIGDHILFTDYKPVKKDSTAVVKPGNAPVAKAVSPLVIKSVPKAPRTQVPTAATTKKSPAAIVKAPRTQVTTAAMKKLSPAATVNTPQSEPVPPAYTLIPIRPNALLSPPVLLAIPENLNAMALATHAATGSTARESSAAKNTAKSAGTVKEGRHFSLPPLGDLPLAEVGMTANDIVYLSASVKAGIQYIYGIGTLGVSSGGLRFRYGAGLRIPLNESAAIQAEFTTGALSRYPIDSMSKKKLLRERLNSYGLSWSKTIRPRLNLQLELNYSTLRKSSDSTLQLGNKETNYYKYGKPLYNARIGSNGDNDELNSWIGARISLFYNLRRNDR